MAGHDIYSSGGGRRTWPPLTIPLIWAFIYAGVWSSGQIARLIGLNVTMGSGRWQDNLAALFASLPVAGVLWLWLRFWEKRGAGAAGLLPWVPRLFTSGLLWGLILVVAIVAAGFAVGIYEFAGLGAWAGLTPIWCLAAVLAVVGTIVQATATEAMYRGWMLETFTARWGPLAGIVANIVACFAIQGYGQIGSPEGMVWALNMALIAWLLSICALRDGSLWGVCGFHAAWNLAMGLGFGLNIDGGRLSVTPAILVLSQRDDAPGWLSGSGYGPDGSVILTLIIAATLAWQLRGRSDKAPRVSRGRSNPYADELIDH